MSRTVLLVDGRVLDDDHPGVRRFWVPVLCAWAALGGRGLVAHRLGRAPEPQLINAGFSAVELSHSAYDPRGMLAARSVVRRSPATVTLSPLYLTLDGAARNVGTVFDLAGRTHSRSWLSRAAWEVMMWRTVRRSSRVVCATRAAGDQLVAAFPRLRDGIIVVPAVAPSVPRREDGDGFAMRAQAYALAIASHRPHKRLDLLAAAWARSGSAVPLVMLGAGTERLNAPPAVRGLGFVSDDEVDAWSAGAACLVSASVAEGFGLPVLAAMARGTPVVAARQPSLEEIAGDSAIWVDRDDIAGLVRAAQAVISNPSAADSQVKRGRLLARAFTAQRAATQLQHALAQS